MTVSWQNIDDVMASIIDEAIQKGKLFELIFSEDGRRLWASYPEDRFKQMVKQRLKKLGGDAE